MRAAEHSDEDVRLVVREAVRGSGVTIIGLCWNWPLSLRRVLEAAGMALQRGWLVDAGEGRYQAP